MKNKKKTGDSMGGMRCILIFVALGIIILYGFWVNNNAKEKKKIDFAPDVSIKLTRKINLTEEKETHKFNSDLKIEFISKDKEKTDDGTIYKYIAEVYLGDKKVLTIDNDNIYSENAAAYFEIIQSNDIYIFNSFIANQCNSSKLNIITKDGTSLDVDTSALDFDISKDLTQFTLTTCDSCMSNNCKIEKYKIVKDNIEKIK